MLKPSMEPELGHAHVQNLLKQQHHTRSKEGRKLALFIWMMTPCRPRSSPLRLSPFTFIREEEEEEKDGVRAWHEGERKEEGGGVTHF